MDGLLAYLRRYRPPAADPAADGDLLARFAVFGDEAAFAEVVRRHGPLVYAACRRLLSDPADADDAFQAVFLVLVRRAGRLSGRATVGPWLHRTAVLTARNLRRRNAHRLARTRPLPDHVPDLHRPGSDTPFDIDAALLALPEKARAAVVLCHLEGYTRREAAARLGCPEGTLSAVLARALARLRSRLGGADPIAVLTAVGVSAAVPSATTAAAIRAAGVFRTASLSAVGVSPAAADLTRGVLRMIWVKKLTAVGLTVTALAGLGVGVGTTITNGTRAAAQGTPPPGVPVPNSVSPEEALGDQQSREDAVRDARARVERELDETLDRAG